MRIQSISIRNNNEAAEWAEHAVSDIEWLLECLDEARELVWQLRSTLPAGHPLVARCTEWRDKVTADE